ncbi:MAG TPA: rhombosortase [Gammaproteobacteria bacterium]|nr:rhombosortase [Gammaproteobacteria bacterium]
MNSVTLSQLRAHSLLPLVLTLCVTLFALGGSELTVILRFDRVALLHEGQLWRLFTGHLVHLGWSHTGLNIAGLALIWALVGQRFDNRQWSAIITILMLGISLGLLIFNPTLAWYVGLSGVLHGMLTAGTIADIRSGDKSAWVLLILIAAKLAWEQTAGALPGSEAAAGGAVIVDAHFYGGVLGLVLGGLFKPKAV